MKKFVTIVSLSLITTIIFSQSLLDIYKTGTVYLEPDTEYGGSNNWDDIFSGYNDKVGSRKIGHDKKIAISDQGEVFMSHKNHHQIWVFDSTGKLKAKYGEKGGKAHQFVMIPSIETIIGNKYYVTVDVNGRMKLFHLNGEYYKSIKIDFMVRGVKALNNNTLIVSGSVLWKKESRYIVTTLDIESGKYKIIYSTFRDRPAFKTTKFVAGGDTIRFGSTEINKSSIHIPGNLFHSRPAISFSDDGNFVVAEPKNVDVEYFNTFGKLESKFNLDIEPIRITEKDVEERYNSLSDMFEKTISRVKQGTNWSEEKKEAWLNVYSDYVDRTMSQYKDIANYFPTLPFFSTILFDNEDNMLVFEFTNKEDTIDNKFSVIAYNNKGEKIAEASFISDDYKLKITDKTILFHKGYLYAICEKKDSTAMPLRLIRFKLSSVK